MTAMPDHCHCGSTLVFADCCALILSGQQQAQTAEQLMRSRYSAFCEHDINYLIASLHPSKRQSDDKEQLSTSMQDCQWLSLKIINTLNGSASDLDGEIEFIAHYTQQHNQPQLGSLHERSRFVKEQGQWFYVDGDLFATPSLSKLGRNDPCWCGSGKKFKKCHS